MMPYYRYRLPCWLRCWICALERAMLPILIFQLLRTFFFPSLFDVLLLGVVAGLFTAFYLRWI